MIAYLEEGEHHATAQDEFVDLAQHGLNDRDLRRDLIEITIVGVLIIIIDRGVLLVVSDGRTVMMVEYGLND